MTGPGPHGALSVDPAGRPVGWHYREARLRLDEVLRPLSRAQWETPVPACPGWRVRDVLAHLLGNIEDAGRGRLAGPPSPELTAEQTARHADDEPVDLLDRWAAASPRFEAAIAERWPAAIDIVSHEHDVRSALGRPGARDHESVVTMAIRLADGIASTAPIAVHFDGAPTDDGGDRGGLALRTSPFELFRLRLGRRSRQQVCELDWSANPDGVVDDLFIFGPASEPIVE